MARKPGTRVEFVLFDVLYEDGSQRSNRKIPSDVLGGTDGDASARTVIHEQDRVIVEKEAEIAPTVRVGVVHHRSWSTSDARFTIGTGDA